ncbi:MAG TPA: hypothetical protein VGS62_04415 [Streptosporangiaceae bacterium]|nr:hypothetical protein [Streptosporangiaceae bacterium]
MSDPQPPVVVLTPDKTGPYQHGDPLAVTVVVLQPGTVKIAVQVTLADGTPVSGELDLPVLQSSGSGFQVASATDSLGDSFTVELAENGASVLRTTLGAPPA